MANSKIDWHRYLGKKIPIFYVCKQIFAKKTWPKRGLAKWNCLWISINCKFFDDDQQSNIVSSVKSTCFPFCQLFTSEKVYSKVFFDQVLINVDNQKIFFFYNYQFYSNYMRSVWKLTKI